MSKDSLFLFSFLLTRLRQMMGEPNLLRQAAKWRPAGVANGVALSTTERERERERERKSRMQYYC